MDREEFFQVFCRLMRLSGKVKLSHVANAAGIGLTEARKHMKKLEKNNEIKKVGRGRATVYAFSGV